MPLNQTEDGVDIWGGAKVAYKICKTKAFLFFVTIVPSRDPIQNPLSA
jgi:hypothetical protein